MSTTIMLRNISPKINNDSIIDFFAEIGTPMNIKFVMANGGGNLRAYVKFKKESIAKKALKLDNNKFLGKRVNISVTDGNENNEKGQYYRRDAEIDYIESTTILVTNLPIIMSVNELIRFFGPKGIDDIDIFPNKLAKQYYGMAAVKFSTSSKAKKALKKSGEVIGGRPINVVPVEEAPISIISNIVRLSNLSYIVDDGDIIKFFENVGEPINIKFHTNSETGKFYGRCDVEFVTANEVAYALKKSGKQMKHRKIGVELADKEEKYNSSSSSSH